MSTERDELRETVRARYATAATQFTKTAKIADPNCCGPAHCGAGEVRFGEDGFGRHLYSDDERAAIPDQAVQASLGCGNPLAVADLHVGEIVLDLGSGAGLDVLLSARRVGPTGKAYGLDMTEEMLALAEANARTAGAVNVEFLKGTIEAVPLPDAAVDVVISNCVINLSTDKPAVFAETLRVLRPGGRLGITDVVAEDHLTPADRLARGTDVGCIAGALTVAEYRAALSAAGFTGTEVTPTHLVADGMHSAIIRAVKPPGGSRSAATTLRHARHRGRAGGDPVTATDEHPTVVGKLSTLDRLLPVWIGAAMAAGLLLGRTIPGLGNALSAVEVDGISLPIALGLLVMMYPVLAKVRYDRLDSVTGDRRLLFGSLLLNWIAGPALMFTLAWLLLPDLPEYRTGLIIVGLARCIAMVIIWNDLACGDREAAAVLVALNSLFQVIMFAVLGWFYLSVLPGWLGLPQTQITPHRGRSRNRC